MDSPDPTSLNLTGPDPTSPDLPIRVLLADDQTLVRAGFRLLLERSPDIAVVAEADDGVQAVEACRRLRPDVVLMDIRMPVLDGIAATRQILDDPAGAGSRVVVLTTFESDEFLFAALRAGASGFLAKDIEPDGLRQAVRVVARGDALLSPRITRRLIAAFAARPARPVQDPDRLSVLTQREREVMILAAGGLSNIEIGQELHMSPATAKTHVNKAMAKLGARDRAQLIVIAYQTGLVS
jgi:DNA-binding NarL/FixJ family response regulator